MTTPLDPDELLTRARQAITRGLQLQESGDTGPAQGWLADAAKRIEDLDAYLTMGGRLPSQWRRARPAAAPSRVDRSTAVRCTATLPGPVEGTRITCTRMRGHHGNHHDGGTIAWK